MGDVEMVNKRMPLPNVTFFFSSSFCSRVNGYLTYLNWVSQLWLAQRCFKASITVRLYHLHRQLLRISLKGVLPLTAKASLFDMFQNVTIIEIRKYIRVDTGEITRHAIYSQMVLNVQANFQASELVKAIFRKGESRNELNPL